MNTKHTPGPWLVEFFEDSARIRQEKGYEHTITVVSTWGDSQRETDARLIAAAPELLIALDDAFDWICELLPAYSTGGTRLDNLRRALAKATGGDE